uniref:Uncharacterized protein n=1 Tax=Sphaerodactylus townsendi TaxID=933632 RepID=A0ACB8FXN1_9SAUR
MGRMRLPCGVQTAPPGNCLQPAVSSRCLRLQPPTILRPPGVGGAANFCGTREAAEIYHQRWRAEELTSGDHLPSPPGLPLPARLNASRAALHTPDRTPARAASHVHQQQESKIRNPTMMLNHCLTKDDA